MATTTKTPTTDDLSKQVEQLKSDIASLTDTIAKLGKAKGEEMAETVRGQADAARSSTEAQLAELQRQALSNIENAEDYVRRNPAAALGIAAGIGVLVGMLTARR